LTKLLQNYILIQIRNIVFVLMFDFQ